MALAQTITPTASVTAQPAQTQALQLTAAQQSSLDQQLADANPLGQPLKDIASLGRDAEQGLHRTLDSFLAQIDRFDNVRLFALLDALREDVDQEDLPALAERILNNPPSLWQRALGFFNKKALARALAMAWEETQRIASGKTRNLTHKVAQLERELATEQARLAHEIDTLEQLKDSYRDRFEDFLLATAYLKGLVAKADDQTRALAATNSFAMDEAQQKLQALQSRALALEGTLSRLPSDQLVIRQLQNAGLATWQETSTTAAARFASIKMTLLTLHGALMTQGVQRLSDQGRALDENLSAVQARLLGQVVDKSANLAGDNRVAQAQQVQAIVAQSKALQDIVTRARSSNELKFDQAKQLLVQAQQDMLALGQQLRPDAPLTR
jgi:molecular chaperone GrpE (heat shock protein)